MALEGISQFVLAQVGNRQGDARRLRVLIRLKESVHLRGEPSYISIRVVLLSVRDADLMFVQRLV